MLDYMTSRGANVVSRDPQEEGLVNLNDDDDDSSSADDINLNSDDGNSSCSSLSYDSSDSDESESNNSYNGVLSPKFIAFLKS